MSGGVGKVALRGYGGLSKIVPTLILAWKLHRQALCQLWPRLVVIVI